MNRIAAVPLLLLISVSIVAMTLGSPLASADDEGKGGFQLGGTATWVQDPVNPGNTVVQMDVSPVTFGFVRRIFEKDTQVEDLSGQISFTFRFDTGGSCGGGSPRIQLAIDVNDDGTSDGNAFGYTGPFPSFTGCPDDTWLFEDLTSNAQRWDLTQFDAELLAISQSSSGTLCGSFVCTWAQVLTVLGNFPNHHVLRGSVVDDTFVGSGRGIASAFYDNIELGNKKLQSSGQGIN